MNIKEDQKEKITRLEDAVRHLESKLHNTIITHHDEVELQNKVILKLIDGRKRTKKKLRTMNTQIKGILTGEGDNFSDDSAPSMSSFASNFSSLRNRNSVSNAHLASLSEVVRSLNEGLDKQREITSQQQREIDDLREKLSRSERENRNKILAIQATLERFLESPSLTNMTPQHSFMETQGNSRSTSGYGRTQLLVPPPRDTPSGPPSEQTSPNPHARVIGLSLYEYQGHRSGDLDFDANEVIFILKKYSDGWWLGRSHTSGNLGRFPSNYIEELNPNPSSVVATADSREEEPGDLQFSKGDVISVLRDADEESGWCFGEIVTSGIFGWFPPAFTVPSEEVEKIK